MSSKLQARRPRRLFAALTLIAFSIQVAGCGGGGAKSNPDCTDTAPVPTFQLVSNSGPPPERVPAARGVFNTVDKIKCSGRSTSGVVIQPGVILTTAHDTQSRSAATVTFRDAPTTPLAGRLVRHPGARNDYPLHVPGGDPEWQPLNADTDFAFIFLDPNTTPDPGNPAQQLALRPPEMGLIEDWTPCTLCQTTDLVVLGYGTAPASMLTWGAFPVLNGRGGTGDSYLYTRYGSAQPNPTTRLEGGDSGGPWMSTLEPSDSAAAGVPLVDGLGYGIVALTGAGGARLGLGNRITPP